MRARRQSPNGSPPQASNVAGDDLGGSPSHEEQLQVTSPLTHSERPIKPPGQGHGPEAWQVATPGLPPGWSGGPPLSGETPSEHPSGKAKRPAASAITDLPQNFMPSYISQAEGVGGFHGRRGWLGQRAVANWNRPAQLETATDRPSQVTAPGGINGEHLSSHTLHSAATDCVVTADSAARSAPYRRRTERSRGSSMCTTQCRRKILPCCSFHSICSCSSGNYPR